MSTDGAVEHAQVVRLAVLLSLRARSGTMTHNLGDRIRELTDRGSDLIRENPEVAYSAGAGLALLGVWRIFSSRGDYKRKPSAFELAGGSIDRKKINCTFDDYSASYGKEAGTGIVDRNRTTELVRIGLRAACMQIMAKVLRPTAAFHCRTACDFQPYIGDQLAQWCSSTKLVQSSSDCRSTHSTTWCVASHPSHGCSATQRLALIDAWDVLSKCRALRSGD